jgi:hypothetical protein
VDEGRFLRWMRAGSSCADSTVQEIDEGTLSYIVHLLLIILPLLHTHLNITNVALIMIFISCTWLWKTSLLNVSNRRSSEFREQWLRLDSCKRPKVKLPSLV